MAIKKNNMNLGMMSLNDYEVMSTDLYGFLNQSNITGLKQDQVTFSIPSYQRGYSWGKTMVEDFLERISNTDNAPYYLGLVVLAKGDE